ncbi:anionic trypsin-2-like [Anabas testudineus]|uniref:Peptidase S1 domain-containing protein n=1 Tax=Anabas testudineus TaxID=64144 RepID=A0A3Q1H847_ANATE|nr:anionic trypsin-2-like [Anabas testudineus]
MACLVLLSLLWVGVTVSTVVDLQKRIIGGQTCGQNERRYHVKLLAYPDGDFHCGGSLISERWILTAAHCKYPDMYAVLGVHSGRKQVVQIKDPPVIFTDKDKNSNDRFHDLMLLKLPSSTNIRPVGFPDCKKRPVIKNMVQVAGYGATSENNKETSSTLQCAEMEVVDCEILRNILKTEEPEVYNRGLYEHWLCGQTQGVEICNGDSGGGVVYQNRIYGVISTSGVHRRACNDPAGFIDICHEPYFQWIKTTIAPPKKCQWCG